MKGSVLKWEWCYESNHLYGEGYIVEPHGTRGSGCWWAMLLGIESFSHTGTLGDCLAACERHHQQREGVK